MGPRQRRRLAELGAIPLSEQAKWRREKGIFKSFLGAAPDFAGEPIIDWKHNGNASPDIVCTDRLGNRLGVEMTEWLHEQQTHDFSRWERVLRFVSFPSDWNIYVYLNPFGHDCESEERKDIAKQLTEIIAEEVARPRLCGPGRLSFVVHGAELTRRAPILAKHRAIIEGRRLGSGRLRVVPNPGTSSPDDAAEALRSVISKKIGNKSYAAIKQAAGLRSLYLLIYYDEALRKNRWGPDVNIAAVTACAMSSAPSAFDLAFVLMFPAGDASSGRRVYRVQPDRGQRASDFSTCDRMLSSRVKS